MNSRSCTRTQDTLHTTVQAEYRGSPVSGDYLLELEQSFRALPEWRTLGTQFSADRSAKNTPRSLYWYMNATASLHMLVLSGAFTTRSSVYSYASRTYRSSFRNLASLTKKNRFARRSFGKKEERKIITKKDLRDSMAPPRIANDSLLSHLKAVKTARLPRFLAGLLPKSTALKHRVGKFSVSKLLSVGLRALYDEMGFCSGCSFLSSAHSTARSERPLLSFGSRL